MIDALWGEQPPETATATLQSYISNLRRALEPNRAARAEAKILQTNGGGYQLAVTASQVDAMRFERTVIEATGVIDDAPQRCRDLLADALDLWRGPALADFAYADFARNEILRLEEMRMAAIELRIAADLAVGHSTELVAELEELVAVHPFRERLWRHLMLALYRSGRHAEALRAYRRFDEAVADIGISPTEDLRQLELDILNQSPTLATPQRPRAATPASRAAEIVGRTGERQRFRSALDRAIAGRGSVLLYEGEAGVGKTRLLEALDADATAHGFTTAFARCVEIGATPPFWPWTQLARQLGAERLREGAGQYAAHLSPLLPHGDTDFPHHVAPLHRIAEGLAVALSIVTVGAPALLVIDDLDSADPDSLAILAVLAAELESLPIVIVATLRGAEWDAASGLTTTLTELMRLEWVDRAVLPRLALSEVSELVERLAHQEIDQGTLAAIFGRTEGNAFYTIELTKLLLTTSSLSPEKASTAVPATVLEVMGRRLGQLSAAALKLIRVGAIYGRRFDLAVASSAADLEFVDAVAAAEETVRAGLLVGARRAGSYRFCHMIVVDSVTQALGAMRRAQLHHRIAETLEERFGADPARWVEIAHHRHRAAVFAGSHDAVTALARAGDHAMRSNAIHLAEELFVKRHDLVMSEPPSRRRDADEIASLFDLAKVWTWREGYHSSYLIAEQGLVDLDAPAADYVTLPPGDTAPTVAQLLSHRSGIVDAALGPALERTSDGTGMSMQDALDLAVAPGYGYPPGTAFQYGNGNYLLSYHIIESVTDRAYADFITDTVLTRADPPATTMCLKQPPVGWAIGYQPLEGNWQRATRLGRSLPLVESHQANMEIVNSVCSTAPDLVRWTQALRTGAVVSPEHYTLMASPATLTDGTKIPYGLGLQLRRYGDHQAVAHGGLVGGFVSMLADFPEDDVTVALLVNTLLPEDEAGLVFDAVLSAVFDEAQGQGWTADDQSASLEGDAR